MDTLSKLLDFNLISIGDYKIKVYTLVIILLIILITRVILKLIKSALFRRYKGLHLDKGNTYALYQIIIYG